MGVLHVLILECVFMLHPGQVSGQFTAASPTCPGDTFTFRCTVTGDRNGFTTWRVGGSSECNLVHRSTSSSTCGAGNAFIARPGVGFGPGTSGTSFTSTFSGTATPVLNGTVVECFGPANNVDPGNMVGNSILQIRGPPSVPTLSCIDLTEDTNGTVNVNVSWRLSGGDSADFYLISITTTAPHTPYGGLLNITTASVTQYELTGFMADYEYNITVHGVNCGGQKGSESEPLTTRAQAPAAPTSCNVTLLYDQSSRRLQFIDTTWDWMPNQVDPPENCRGLSGIIMYQITFQVGSFEMHKNVNLTACTARKCSHTFNLWSDSVPSSYDSVSVAAMNVVGVGAARTCTTQPISTTNNLLTGDIIYQNSPHDATIICIFLSGFNGSARCTIQYGTDPTYMNLPYSAESIETGTAGDFVSVVLRERLNSSTVHYFTVSAVSGDVTVTVRRTFTTPQYGCNEADLIDQGETLNTASCADRGVVNSSSISGGVVCYNGAIAGSRADYICNDGFVLVGNKATRVCQSDGNWNGSIPRCSPDKADQIGIIGDVVGGVVGGVVGVDVLVIIIFTVYKKCSRKQKKTSGSEDESVPLLSTDRNSFHKAARRGNLDKVKFLVKEGADVNIQDDNGIAPLHVAAKEGRYKIIRYLVARGADINIKDRKGLTPLHVAVRDGNEQTLKFIVDNGATIDIKDDSGESPLDVAAKRGHTEIVQILKEAAVIDEKRRHQTKQHWFLIMSKLGNNLVMDVAYSRATPGTQVISYTKKNPPRPNQLWRKEYCSENTFYLVSKLHSSCKITIKGGNACIGTSGSLFWEEKDGEFIKLIDVKTGKALDVRDASTAPDTPILALDISGESNQMWKYSIPTPFIFRNTDDYFFIESTTGVDMVMDVEHSNPDPGTRVLSYCRNDPGLVHNQLWMKQFVREGEGTFYLVSKLGPDCKLALQTGSAVIDASGSVFEESVSGGGSVKLILSGTAQALHVSDDYACTPITAVPKDRSSKWVLKKHTMDSEETQC